MQGKTRRAQVGTNHADIMLLSTATVPMVTTNGYGTRRAPLAPEANSYETGGYWDGSEFAEVRRSVIMRLHF